MTRDMEHHFYMSIMMLPPLAAVALQSSALTGHPWATFALLS